MIETSLKYATVVGRFVSITGDSPDDDDNNPDIVPLQGTVTFTAKPKAVFGVGADGEPVTINTRRRIVARLDDQGYLTVNGVRGVRLLANDSPGINPAGFTYHVSFSLNDRGQQQFDYDAFDISVPYSDTPHNLLTLSPVPANPGEPILQGVGLARVSFNDEGAFVFDYTNGVQHVAPFPTAFDYAAQVDALSGRIESVEDLAPRVEALEATPPPSPPLTPAGLDFLGGLSPVVPKNLSSGGEYSNTTAAEGQLGRTSRQWFKPVEPVGYARILYQNLSPVRGNVNNPLTITASVERTTSLGSTPAPTVARVTFNGATSVTLAPGQWGLSDPVLIDDPTRAGFYVRTYTGVSTVGHVWPSNGHTRGALYPGELAWWGDRTGTAELTGGFAGTTLAHGPAAILTAPTDRPIVSVMGDSITQGSNDGGAGEGYWSRYGTAQRVRVQRVATSGELARYILDTTNHRDALWLQVSGSDWVVCALGANDVAQWQSAPGIMGHLPKVWARMAAAARKGVYQVTISPNTTSTDSWATIQNQTVRGATESARVAVNEWLRAGAPIEGAGVAGDPGHPLAGVLDVAAAVEDSASGKWLPGMAADGLHPSPAGHAAMADRLAEIAPPMFTNITNSEVN